MSNALSFPPKENLVDLSKRGIFARRGAYMGIGADMLGAPAPGQSFREGRLYLNSRRSTPSASPRGIYLAYFTPLYKGTKVACEVHMTPTELTVCTAYGRISACFADDSMLYLRGENGLSLQVDVPMYGQEIMKKRAENACEAMFRSRCSLVFNALKGGLTMDAAWVAGKKSTPDASVFVEPDENGEFLLAIDESAYAGKIRAAYPAYDEALASVTADWEQFLACVPEVNEDLAHQRIVSSYILWSFLIHASGCAKRTVILMAINSAASSWQMGHNAVALRNNLPIASDLLLSVTDAVSEYGQFSDFVDDGSSHAQSLHPPTQGWMLKWMMRTRDLKKDYPRETLERMYTYYGRYAEWFMLARDDDGDGLPQYDNGDECGFDDSSAFMVHDQVESPDLMAYLALQYDALGDLAEMLDKPDEAAAWHKRCDETVEKMIEVFWNGERFIALSAHTHEVIETDSLFFYVPLILGKKLPQEIIDKMTADLMDETKYLTPYGLATETLTSDVFRVSGFARGWVLAPGNLLVITGLYNAGKVEEAKLAAQRFCSACAKWDSPLLMNPIEGGSCNFYCSWASCSFLVLADMLSNM